MHEKRWEYFSDINSDIEYFIFRNKFGFGYTKISKKEYEGDIYVYKINNDEIKTPKKINKMIYIENLYTINELELSLFLLSSSFYFVNKEYLLIPENIFKILKYSIDFYEYNMIYKNNNFIIKYNKNYDFINLSTLTSLRIICLIISVVGNKYCANNDKLTLMKLLCDKCGIEYTIVENCIEIFMINKELEFKRKEHFKGKIYYSYYDDTLLFIKTGKYTLFI